MQSSGSLVTLIQRIDTKTEFTFLLNDHHIPLLYMVQLKELSNPSSFSEYKPRDSVIAARRKIGHDMLGESFNQQGQRVPNSLLPAACPIGLSREETFAPAEGYVVVTKAPSRNRDQYPFLVRDSAHQTSLSFKTLLMVF